MIKELLKYFPEEGSYTRYLDAFGGSGVVLLNKPQVPVEIYNDLDKNVYSLFKVLRDPNSFCEFKGLCDISLYDEATSDDFLERLKNPNLSLVARAYYFWYVNHTRYNGNINSGFSINNLERRNTSKAISDFLSSVEGLNELHSRLKNVIITNENALTLLTRLDNPGFMFYIDPPYLNRKSNTKYPVDMSLTEHQRLVEILNHLKYAKYLLSGYENDVYCGLNAEKINMKGQEFLWKNY